MEGVKLREYLFGAKSNSPCLTCNHFNMCRHGFACKAFVSYVRSGRYNADLPRFPTRAMFDKLEKDEV